MMPTQTKPISAPRITRWAAQVARSGILLGGPARIAGGYPFYFTGSGEMPVGRTTGGLGPMFQLSSFLK